MNSEKESSERARSLALSTPKVLIVDDEPAALNSAKAILSGANYHVVCCGSAVEALQLLTTQPFDCIITDIVMPVMDGYELVRSLRSSGKIVPRIPILMLTRKRLREDVAAAVQAGADDYILKPIDEQVFLDKIEANIRKGDSKRHVFEHSLHGNSFDAQLKVESKIIAVSETDITLGLPFPASQAMSFELVSHLFEEIGINPPLLRLLYCRKVADGAAISPHLPYEARYAFMGLPELDSGRVRAWLHRQAIERRK